MHHSNISTYRPPVHFFFKVCDVGYENIDNECIIICEEGYEIIDNECFIICEKEVENGSYERTDPDTCEIICDEGFNLQGEECILNCIEDPCLLPETCPENSSCATECYTHTCTCDEGFFMVII